MPKKAKKSRNKVAKVMKEYQAGTLKSSSGEKVDSLPQAIAISMSEQERADKKKSKKPKSPKY